MHPEPSPAAQQHSPPPQYASAAAAAPASRRRRRRLRRSPCARSVPLSLPPSLSPRHCGSSHKGNISKGKEPFVCMFSHDLLLGVGRRWDQLKNFVIGDFQDQAIVMMLSLLISAVLD